jgi:hypothetical protein
MITPSASLTLFTHNHPTSSLAGEATYQSLDLNEYEEPLDSIAYAAAQLRSGSNPSSASSTYATKAQLAKAVGPRPTARKDAAPPGPHRPTVMTPPGHQRPTVRKDGTPPGPHRPTVRKDATPPRTPVQRNAYTSPTEVGQPPSTRADEHFYEYSDPVALVESEL